MSTATSQYMEFRTEFDDLLDHAINVLNAQAGHSVRNERENYGEKIFGKIVCHAMSLQRLMPNTSIVADTEIWDISSAYALSRTILESHEAFAYIAEEKLPDEHLACRIIAWKLHAQERRVKMLNLIGSSSPQLSEVQTDILTLKTELLSDRFLPYVSKEVRGKIEKGDTPPYLTPRNQRLLAAKVNADYFTVALMQLSAHVHTHPYSLHQLFDFRAGTSIAYMLMKVGGQYACAFLAAAVRDMTVLFNPRTPQVPESVQRTLEMWCEIVEKGVKLS